MPDPIATRFAGIAPRRARLILAATLVLITYGVVWSFTASASEPAKQGPEGGDKALYGSVVDRVRRGDGYYQAVGEELLRRGYATTPFWNWRLPSLAVLLAALPATAWGKAVLVLLAAGTVVLWVVALTREEHVGMGMVGGALLFQTLLLCVFSTFFLHHELWAGVLIALSLAAHALDRRGLSVAAGLGALLLRELALPYCGIMLVMAWHEKRRREAAAWVLCVVAFGLYVGAHAMTVRSVLVDGGRAHEGWLQFGGWPFVLKTARYHPVLVAFPWWPLAMVVPLACLGLAGWPGPTGARAGMTVGAYLASFLVVGRSCNRYWGMLYMPLLTLGALYALPATRDLVRSAWAARRHPAAEGPAGSP
jgi:hypothetical protein